MTACSSNSGPGGRHSSNLPIDQQQPSAPSNLSGTALGWDSLFLEWWDAANEDGYRIYRDGSLISEVGANAVTFSDTGLKGGTTYQYTVRAYNDAGESNPCSCVVKTANPPMNVTLNYVGTKLDHDPIAPGEVRLIVLVTDGSGTEAPEMMPSSGSYDLYDRDVAEVSRRIFSSGAVGEYLKISIIAYEDDDEHLVSNLISAALPILAPSLGIPDVSGIETILSAYEQATGKPLFANEDDYVGCYEGFWSAGEAWGVGQYTWQGEGDLRVWFSIWTDSEPASAASKPLFNPSIVDSGWYVNGAKVSTATKGDTVTARLTLSGGEPGQYEMRVGRDKSWASDVVVDTETFIYDGTVAVMELSFVLPYAKGEDSTTGYWLEQWTDGIRIWSTGETYPPRLTVS